MKSESGFIATSLIYTFFLAFIAILTALLSNYIANKTILDIMVRFKIKLIMVVVV